MSKNSASQRVLIVGCGRIAGGWNDHDESKPLTHVLAYRQLGANIVGCCDSVDERAKQFADRWSIDVSGSDLCSVLSLTNPDVVSVCTPHEHRLIPMQAICATESVKAILLEKPVALSIDEARSLQILVSDWGRPVVVNFFRAFDEFYRAFKTTCLEEELGKINEIVIRYSGAAWTNAPHFIERALDMFGEPTCTKRLGGDDFAPMFSIEFKAPPVSTLFLPTAESKYSIAEFDVLFENGRIRVVDSEHRTEQFVAAPSSLYANYFNLVRSEQFTSAHPNPMAIVEAVAKTLAAAEVGVDQSGTFRRGIVVTQILESVGAKWSPERF